MQTASNLIGAIKPQQRGLMDTKKVLRSSHVFLDSFSPCLRVKSCSRILGI